MYSPRAMRRHADIDVLCVGEAVVDLAPARPGARIGDGSPVVPMLGGGPANTAVGLAHLGRRVGLCGRLGDDAWGRFCEARLRSAGVDVSGIVWDPVRPTGVVFMDVARSGQARFLSYRRGAAERALEPADLPAEHLARARLIHLGTNPLLAPRGAQALDHVVSTARRHKVRVSLDANLRPHLWPTAQACVAAAGRLIARVDVLKATLSEGRLLTGADAPEEVAARLSALGPAVVALTLAEEGCVISCDGEVGRHAALAARVVDETGAGDAFMAGLLSCLAGADVWDPGRVRAAVDAALEAGARAVARLGATTWTSPAG